MEIEFVSKKYFNFFTGNYSGKQKFPENIIMRFKDKIDFIMEAENIYTLSKIRSLNIEKYDGHRSVRINKQYIIEFNFIKPKTIVIIKISKHYEN